MNKSEVIEIILKKDYYFRYEVKYNIFYGEEYLINKKSDNKNNKSDKKDIKINDDI